MDGFGELESRAFLFFCGLVIFFIGLKMTTGSSQEVCEKKLAGDDFVDYVLIDDEQEESPYGGVLLGTVIMCIGAVPVGGVLLGWDAARIFSEFSKVF